MTNWCTTSIDYCILLFILQGPWHHWGPLCCFVCTCTSPPQTEITLFRLHLDRMDSAQRTRTGRDVENLWISNSSDLLGFSLVFTVTLVARLVFSKEFFFPPFQRSEQYRLFFFGPKDLFIFYFFVYFFSAAVISSNLNDVMHTQKNSHVVFDRRSACRFVHKGSPCNRLTFPNDVAKQGVSVVYGARSLWSVVTMDERHEKITVDLIFFFFFLKIKTI